MKSNSSNNDEQALPLTGLDSTDVRILEILQADGRISNADLAEAIGLSPSPCLRRVKRLEKEGIIAAYSARLDTKKLGWHVSAFVSISLGQHGQPDVDRFQAGIAELPQVTWCYALSGSNDLLLRIVAEDLDGLYRLMVELGALPGVKDIQSSVAIQELKNSRSLPLGGAV
ncbi:Lrp/AsnC family transcriptional regulator [Exilibacterium tricleocarpae]|uniref:Lrp/AsnC family transcriptional regulator n=1 Tax=Exilibacterium tricleocarpae TaxID=2591008 RepID=A0A545T5U3_9GAMM|nr:Lrp/AsnC family transcriptional regulator [Exilibacterium tricleocarpae]TQV72610.1 Lrp/AsnC family transcriptional regulator [Exilibacterium tricleocarpae]